MTFIDSSGTHLFSDHKVSDINSYSDEKRSAKYTSIEDIESESIKGTTKFISFDFFDLNPIDKSLINQIFIDNDLTSISNVDEVNAGEQYTTLSGATNEVYIKTKNIDFVTPLEIKDVLVYETRLKIRFDTATIQIK